MAKKALAECERIDECKDWADKAAALGSYAKQSQDESLFKMATRIQARAIRRCGELLKEIEASHGGRPAKETSTGTDTSLTRKQVAEQAGLSKRQKDTAIRVANVPEGEFEAQVESDSPPTVTALAEQGTQKKVFDPFDLMDSGIDFEDHKRATYVLGVGRNRRLACNALKRIPDYVLLDGQDPLSYILSANVHRRHMTKSQRAMVVAMIHPEGDKGGRGNKTSSNLAETSGFSQRCLQQARFILRHAPDLASQVRAGHLSLDNAHEEARVRKGRSDTYNSRFNALKAVAPDLAERVTEGQLNLEEAEAAERERAEQARQRKKLLAEALHDLASRAYLIEHEVQRERVATFVISEAELYKKWNPDPIDEVLHALEVFAEHAGPLLARIIELKAEKENAE